jgi:hypothetical protein
MRTKEAFPLHSERHTLSLGRLRRFLLITHRGSNFLVAALIRVGLLLALIVLLMADNAQEHPAPHHGRTGSFTSWLPRIRAAGTRTSRAAS